MAQKRKKSLEVDGGVKVHPIISQFKGEMRFGKQGKLSTRYIGPSKCSEWIEKVAYHLALLSELDRVQNGFHVSMLKRYIPDPHHILKHTYVELSNKFT